MSTTIAKTSQPYPKVTPIKAKLKEAETPQTKETTQVKPSEAKSQMTNSTQDNLIFTVQKDSPPGLALCTPKISEWISNTKSSSLQ